MIDFDLQSFLQDMRHEQKQDISALTEKVDDGFKEVRSSVAAHDTRLVVVEGTRKALLWFGATVLTLLLPVLYDLVMNHWTKP
jgi:hypothetical protein